jgi:CRP-like cAMP-binding protein
MTEHSEARGYLADRLDGARDLYLLALALGVRGEGATLFGPMIREARIHFTAVIEECRLAGLDTGAIAEMLGEMNEELVDSIRPEIWERLEQLIARRRGAAG